MCVEVGAEFPMPLLQETSATNIVGPGPPLARVPISGRERNEDPPTHSRVCDCVRVRVSSRARVCECVCV